MMSFPRSFAARPLRATAEAAWTNPASGVCRAISPTVRWLNLAKSSAQNSSRKRAPRPCSGARRGGRRTRLEPMFQRSPVEVELHLFAKNMVIISPVGSTPMSALHGALTSNVLRYLHISTKFYILSNRSTFKVYTCVYMCIPFFVISWHRNLSTLKTFGEKLDT